MTKSTRKNKEKKSTDNGHKRNEIVNYDNVKLGVKIISKTKM